LTLLESEILGLALREREGSWRELVSARGPALQTPHQHNLQRPRELAAGEFVLRTDEGLGAARIALARRTAKELAIDPARLVTFCRQHVQSAQ
jgi:hypothetical protein